MILEISLYSMNHLLGKEVLLNASFIIIDGLVSCLTLLCAVNSLALCFLCTRILIHLIIILYTLMIKMIFIILLIILAIPLQTLIILLLIWLILSLS